MASYTWTATAGGNWKSTAAANWAGAITLAGTDFTNGTNDFFIADGAQTLALTDATTGTVLSLNINDANATLAETQSGALTRTFINGLFVNAGTYVANQGATTTNTSTDQLGTAGVAGTLAIGGTYNINAPSATARLLIRANIVATTPTATIRGTGTGVGTFNVLGGTATLAATTNLDTTSLTVTVQNASLLLLQGAVSNAGTISVQNTGTLSVASTSTITNTGTINTSNTSTLAVNGRINVNSGFLAINGAVSGTGTIDLGTTTTGMLGLGGTLIAAAGSTVFAAPSGSFAPVVAGLAVSTDLTIINGINVYAGGFLGDVTISHLTGTLGSFNGTTTPLTITDTAGTPNTYTITLAGDYSTRYVKTQVDTRFPVGSRGIDVFLSSVVCFGAGTTILTPDGDTAVEHLQPGDSVMVLEDGLPVARPVVWVGEREMPLTSHPNIDAIAPVRFLKGALGETMPRRDMILSPDHCLFIDGALIPAKLLVNDMTILRERGMASVTYYHVELETHGILLAEGVPAESYLDTGNRAFFSNAGLATILYPELTINANLRSWAEDACAPLTVAPDAVKPVWDRFASRASALGFTRPDYATTQDADPHLIVDGKRVRPLAVTGGIVSFMVPAGARSVRLASRASNPGTLTPWLDDQRTLGVAIRGLTLRGQQGEFIYSADHPALVDGWHTLERANDGAMWRWTNGSAALPVQDGPFVVEIVLSETIAYIENRAAA